MVKLEVEVTYDDLSCLEIALGDSTPSLSLSMLELWGIHISHRVPLPQFLQVVDSINDPIGGCFCECT